MTLAKHDDVIEERANEMPASGNVIFMPWVAVPMTVRVGRFRFCPIDTKTPAPVVDADIAETVAQVLQRYVGQKGKPIGRCTIVLRARSPQAWNIPDKMWADVTRAANMLALACLAEQRFLQGHLSPHLNSTMFRTIGQGVTAGSDRLAVFYPRRGGGLNVGGLRFNDIIFQAPPQIEGTGCECIGTRLLKALEKARRTRHALWEPIAGSLELFLLGHAETAGLGADTCAMLSAMAFERLLEPKQRNAQGVAETFADLWAPFSSITLAKAKRIKPDHKPAFAAAQTAWPLHRKWMKELYEARSSRAHSGPRSDFSRNWKDWQHIIIAAFTYPFAVKLRLSAAGFYQLNAKEMGACEALDKLLDSHWGRGWQKPPEWSNLLSLAEAERVLRADLEDAYREASQATVRRTQAGRARKIAFSRGYD